MDENGALKKKQWPKRYPSVRETVLAVFETLQMDPAHSLLAFAKENPIEFYRLAAKLIPLEVVATVEVKAEINFTKPKPAAIATVGDLKADYAHFEDVVTPEEGPDEDRQI